MNAGQIPTNRRDHVGVALYRGPWHYLPSTAAQTRAHCHQHCLLVCEVTNEVLI